MDLFTTVKNGSESLSLKKGQYTKGSAKKVVMNGLSRMKSEHNQVFLFQLKRRLHLSLLRIFRRGTWLSIQCFSLASLYNLYLAVLDAQSEQMRQKRIMKFSNTASILLKRYRISIYTKYKKTLGKGKSRNPTLLSLEKAAGIIYEELNAVNRLYQRKLQWKRIRERAKALIGG
jgi:hypothetical protein